MKIRRKIAVWLVGFCVMPMAFTQNTPPKPIAVAEFKDLLGHEPMASLSATVTFLNDRELGLNICDTDCRLMVLDLENGKLKKTAETVQSKLGAEMLPYEGNGLLVDNLNLPTFRDPPDTPVTGELRLYNKNLLSYQIVASVPLHRWNASATGKTFVDVGDGKHWVAYRTAMPAVKLLEGNGQALATSDEAVVFVTGTTVHIQNLGGKELGSFAGEAGCNKTNFLQTDRLLFTGCNRHEIRNLQGKLVQKVAKRGGVTISSNGRRVLSFDTARQVGFWQSTGETAVTVLLPGGGMIHDDDADNVEIIRVMDITSGEDCLMWKKPLTGMWGSAPIMDLSPSGEMLAMVNHTQVSVYRLRATCK